MQSWSANLKKIAVRSSPGPAKIGFSRDPAKIGFSPDPVRSSPDPCPFLAYTQKDGGGARCTVFFLMGAKLRREVL